MSHTPSYQLVQKSTKPRKAKFSRDRDLLEDPVTQQTEEGSEITNLDFKEITDEAQLEIRSTVVNRAPIMTAWAMIVAEKLGFKHEEALSIGRCPSQSYDLNH